MIRTQFQSYFLPIFFSPKILVLVLVLDLVLVPEPDPKSAPVLAGGCNQPNRVTAQQWFVHGYLNAILLLSISVVHF